MYKRFNFRVLAATPSSGFELNINPVEIVREIFIPVYFEKIFSFSTFEK